MAKRAHTPEQIVQKLREAEVELARGATVGAAAKKIGVTEHTYCRWRSQYGGMGVDQAKRLKELVAGKALGISILKGAAAGSF